MVWVPWDIDRTFWEVMSPDQGKLLANAVRWATIEELPVTVTGQGVIDVTAWRQKESQTVHFVNLSNPMMMKGPYREAIPLGGHRVRVRLTQGRTVNAVRLLVSDAVPRFEVLGGQVSLTVPSIGVHEVVAIDFA